MTKAHQQIFFLSLLTRAAAPMALLSSTAILMSCTCLGMEYSVACPSGLCALVAIKSPSPVVQIKAALAELHLSSYGHIFNGCAG